MCGNNCYKAFTITTAEGASHAFDSFECAIHMLAPSRVRRRARSGARWLISRS